MSVFYIRDVEQNREQISKLTQEELFDINIHCMRKSLFKYFPNSNFSKEALINNTVHLSAPSEFDDPYDCNLFIDGDKFALQRICYYASLCGIIINQEWNYVDVSRNVAMRIYEHISSGGSLETLFSMNKTNDLVHAHQEYFLLSLKKELMRLNADGNSYYRAINNVIDKEYDDMQVTANRFKISCFTETPYSILMWSHYARFHQGFCIEYETPVFAEENEQIYFNLFPVIYTDTRIDFSELSLNWKATGMLSKAELWDFYKYGLLCKSLDWKYQKEWRLISYDNSLTDKKYNCKFFKIKRVYLGNKMSKKDRLEIIEICKNKYIPYTGVTIASDQFRMRDCDMLCEDCVRIRQYTETKP